MGSKEEAIALKNKGNDAFKAHDWPSALDFYTKAIETYDKEPSFYTNRAQVCSLDRTRATTYLVRQANLKVEAYGFAVADADKAIELDPNNVKVRHTITELE